MDLKLLNRVREAMYTQERSPEYYLGGVLS